MALIVQKFGGSSVKDRDRIFNVARIVANTHNAGNDVVVVVSAQGDTTDDLIAKAGEITHNPSAREMDMLLASGEQISIALLAMALNELGCHAISLTGWQAGFRTDRAYTKARITRLETERISSEPWDAAAPIPVLWPLLLPCTLTAARSTRMWRAFIPPTRARCATPASWKKLPLTRCWSWHLWAHRC